MPSHTGLGREEIKKDGTVKVIRGHISVIRKKDQSQPTFSSETTVTVNVGDIIWWLEDCQWEWEPANNKGLQ
jgi:hypothetical protein